MGCPPDPIELDLWKAQDKVREAEAKRGPLRAELAAHLEVLRDALARAGGLHPLAVRAHAALEEARHALAAPVTEPQAPSGPLDSSVESYMHHIADVHGDANAVGAEVKRIENALCEGRDVLLKLAPTLPEPTPPELQDAIVREREKHLVHRRDDVATRLAWLRQQRGFAETRHQYGSGRGEKAAAKRELKALDVEIARVEALTDEQLLASRDL